MTNPVQTAARPAKIDLKYSRRVKAILYDAVADGINMVCFVLVLAGARWLVETLLGHDRLFDQIPIKYLFDGGDVAILTKFIYNTIKGSSKNARSRS